MFLLINKMYDVPKIVLEFEVALFSEMLVCLVHVFKN